MGESLQGSNRICCVVRPERECNVALAYFFVFFIHYYFPIRFYHCSQNKIFLFWAEGN
jgi:hypothetical protein